MRTLSPICKAAKRANRSKVERLLEQGCRVNQRLAIYAVESGDLAFAKWIYSRCEERLDINVLFCEAAATNLDMLLWVWSLGITRAKTIDMAFRRALQNKDPAISDYLRGYIPEIDIQPAVIVAMRVLATMGYFRRVRRLAAVYMIDLVEVHNHIMTQAVVHSNMDAIEWLAEVRPVTRDMCNMAARHSTVPVFRYVLALLDTIVDIHDYHIELVTHAIEGLNVSVLDWILGEIGHMPNIVWSYVRYQYHPYAKRRSGLRMLKFLIGRYPFSLDFHRLFRLVADYSDLNAARWLYSTGLITRPNFTQTVFRTMSKSHKHAIRRWLIETSEPVMAVVSHTHTMLTHACADGDLRSVRLLVRKYGFPSDPHLVDICISRAISRQNLALLWYLADNVTMTNPETVANGIVHLHGYRIPEYANLYRFVRDKFDFDFREHSPVIVNLIQEWRPTKRQVVAMIDLGLDIAVNANILIRSVAEENMEYNNAMIRTLIRFGARHPDPPARVAIWQQQYDLGKTLVPVLQRRHRRRKLYKRIPALLSKVRVIREIHALPPEHLSKSMECGRDYLALVEKYKNVMLG